MGRYVLADVQGSSRAVMNNNGAGTSAVIARRDYLPFGEEIGSGLGLRTSGQGYNAIDNNRQKFALTERDAITGLDHTWFRKYESQSGRWTSPDPLVGSIANPQSFNRYNYVNNDPVNFVDPTGLECWNITIEGVTYRICPSEAVQIYANYYLDLPGAYTRDYRPLALFEPVPERPGTGPTVMVPPLSQTPTIANVKRDMNIWRARKLPECLKEAARDYDDRRRHLSQRYHENLLGHNSDPPELAGRIASLLTGSLGRTVGGVLLTVAFVDAYHIPKIEQAKRAYERAKAGCHSLYDQRR